jgi:tetratricopeptide (TPR) repeat protein
MTLGAALLGCLATWFAPQTAQSLSDAAALERKIQAVLVENAQHRADPAILTKLADLYLDLGDEQIDAAKRRAAYEEGAKYAGQALVIQERNAQAHYLYAANLGSAAQLKGVMASAMNVAELKTHVRRALELQPDHPPALHMMGMMLDELPRLLGGDASAALTYLQRATATDPSYVHARLDLARAYIKRRAFDDARRELGIIVETPPSSLSSDSARRHREEAATLLDSLPGR